MSDSAGKRAKPWDGYVERAEDRECMEVLRDATSALQTALVNKGITSALIGGTALRLVEGLPRVSRDLDLKVTRATTGSDEAVIESVNARRGWSARKASEDEEARGHEGIIITNERTGEQHATAIDLIPGTLGATDRVGVAAEWLCERGGLMTYPTHVLAQLKMNTLIGERPREIAHDVFDVAWLMDRHGYLVDGEHRTALKRWLAQAKEDEETWIEVFRQEPNQSWRWNETIEAMSEGLDRADEIVKEAAKLVARMREIQHRTGDARIRLTVDEHGRVEGAITAGDGRTQGYGRITRSEVIAMALRALNYLNKQEIPEMVLELERNRKQQQALARARSRR